MSDDRASWRSPELGEPTTIELPQGRLRAYVRGEGPPVVFLHGLLLNANLWRKIVPPLAEGRRCVTLDLPLGSHPEPMPDAELTPPALADIVAAAIERLELGPVTLVGNDTGGAIAQLVATRHPDLLDRLVLTSCDSHDIFPPKLFSYLRVFGRFPAALPVVFAPVRLRAARRLPIALGWLAKRPIDRDAEDSYVLRPFESAAVRRDLGRVIAGVDVRYTQEAAEALKGFRRPVLIAWSAEDRFFPRENAERLARDIPDARLELIEDAYTFSMEDNPDAVAAAIGAFAPESGASATQHPSSAGA